MLITGGTQGLGRALTEVLVELEAQVTIVARTKSDVMAMQQTSDHIFGIAADMAEKEDIHKISGQALGMMEGIDVLINNASILGELPLQSLLDTECESLEEVLQANLMGPFRLIKAVLPIMKFHGKGLVINISSDAAVNPYPTWGSYAVSKAALDHLTAVWRTEINEVDFISLDPGDMHTKMHLDAIPEANIDALYEPEEVARQMIHFLALQEFEKTRYSASQWRDYV